MDHQQIKPDLGSDPKKPSFSWERLRRSYRILSYIRPYRGYFLAAMVMLAGGSLVFMALLGLPGEMANTAVGKPKFELGLKVRDYGIVFLIILVFQGILSFLRTYFFAIVSEKGMADLRKDLYRKIITQPVYFFEERRVGELSSRITADIEKLQSVFSITLAEFFRQLIILIAGIIVIIIDAITSTIPAIARQHLKQSHGILGCQNLHWLGRGGDTGLKNGSVGGWYHMP